MLESKPNELIKEKSPYLLQHSHNPVNWYAWNENTLSLAKSEDKPIFLSIGYSTCYWCHVMERECFENEDIAKLLNDTFINIKVDREERPDLDKVYMSALQSMTGSGGWPMSMFLTPDLKPFYGATYIPPKAKYGRAGFEDIILQIDNLWKNKKEEILKSSDEIFKILNNSIKFEDNILDYTIIEKGLNQSIQLFDDENGGFGNGNKFPRPTVLDFLLNSYYTTKDNRFLDIVTFTLRKMYKGGIYDNIDKGFHRYSVDTLWRVPHFEKMLYDQAQISNTYFDVYSLTKDEVFLEAGRNTLEYVMNFLVDEKGGFYSAEDAESAITNDNPNQKREGYFYLWRKEEINKILGNEDADIFCYACGVMHDGNTISDPHKIFEDSNVLYKSSDIYQTAKKFEKTPEDIQKILDDSIIKLKEVRDLRPRPFLDKKIITSWNALMISAFVKGYMLTKEHKYKTHAVRAVSFLIYNLYKQEEEKLYHRYIDGEVKYNATLEDYAFLIKALLDFHNISFSGKLLTLAKRLIEKSIELFYDEENGGFFDTEINQADIIYRNKEIYDGAEPSGNSVMSDNLFRAFIIFKEERYYKLAEKNLKLFYKKVSESPFSSPYYLTVINNFLNYNLSLIVSGNLRETEFNNLLDFIHKSYLPIKNIIHYNNVSVKIIDYLKELNIEEDKTQVFICKNFICNLPVSNTKELSELIKQI